MKLSNSLTVYWQKPMFALFWLGFSSGLPLMLVFSTLSVWLKDVGLEKSAIGLFALVKTPYAFKFLWAPMADKLSPPGALKKLGRRRGWAIITQVGLIFAILGLGYSDPRNAPYVTALWAIGLTFFSASQDIVVDAYRVERVRDDEQAAATAIFVTGARIAALVSGGAALWFSEYIPWSMVYVIMAGLQCLGIVTILLCKEPDQPIGSTIQSAKHWLYTALIESLLAFRHQPLWIALLALVLAYKLGEVFLGNMANVFYLETGFTKTQIAEISKVFGLLATIAGGFIGGAMANYLGLWRFLVLGLAVQSLSNLLFIAQAHVGADPLFLTGTILVDNISGGIGTTALLTLFAALCQREYTATQFALLTALTALSRDLISSSAGFVVDATGWAWFFGISTMLGIPALMLLIVLRKTIKALHHDPRLSLPSPD